MTRRTPTTHKELSRKQIKRARREKRRTGRVKRFKRQRGGKKMQETIIKMQRGPFPKKYTAIVKNKKTKKTRKIHFGDRRYQQYKDEQN